MLVVIVINVLEHLVMTVIQVVSRTDVEPTVYRVTVLHFSGGQASNSQCCPSFVSYHEIWRTAPRILPKLGQKLRGHKWGTVARPDFPGKIWIIQ